MHIRIKIVFLFTVAWIVFSGFSAGESQLSKLMLVMKKDMYKMREDLNSGNITARFNKKRYEKIYTAKVSSESKKGEHFNEYAKAFLVQCERMNNAAQDQRKIEYNNLVSACIRCHESYCPWPLTMLKKIKLN